MRFSFVAIFILIICATTVDAQENPADAILDVLAQRPQDASLVVYSLDDPDDGVFHNANVKRPLASTIKILVLAEYARRVVEGALDPGELVPLDSVEVYYFPGTDGGAHAMALEELGQDEQLDVDALSIGQIANAMIRFSDNAAADYLIVRFGREAMDAIPELLGLQNADPPSPISGIFLTWNSPYIEGDDPSIYPAEDDDRAWMFAHRLRASEDFADEMAEWMEGMTARMSYDAQAAAALSFPAGTAREYAGLMARMAGGDLISEEVSATMLGFLDWPMENPGVQAAFDLLATKGGSLAGILTSAWVAKAKAQDEGGGDSTPAVLSLFMEGLPADIFGSWATTGTHQQVEVRLLLDPDFRELVRERLGE